MGIFFPTTLTTEKFSAREVFLENDQFSLFVLAVEVKLEMQVWLIPGTQELEVDTFEQERNICLKVAFWLSALWWGTHAICSCVESSLPSDFKHWPWDVQPISGWEEPVSQSTEIALFSKWSAGVSEEDCPWGAAAAASSAFSGDIAEARQDTAMIDDTSFSRKKKIKSREPHVLLDIKMNKATESNSHCGFKLLLHGLRKFGNLSINESKWKSVNKEISLQRTSPAVLPLEAPCFRSWKHCFCCFCNIKGMQDKQAGEILEFWIRWYRPA